MNDRNQPDFDGVETFTLFIGHNKSGTSLLGSLLDAHRNIVISDEANAIKYIDAGLSWEEVFPILFRASVSEARKGRVTARRLGAYDYMVPGQWQGRAVDPLVVGDSMSGTTTRLLSRRPELLDDIQRSVGKRAVRLLQVVRNPFDPISLMAIRGRRSLEDSVDRYFTACDRLMEIHRRLGDDSILRVYYEDLVASPDEELAGVCAYLGVEAAPHYLEACAGIVDPGFEDSRNRVDWDRASIADVEGRIGEYPFLAGYVFAHPGRGTTSD